MTYTESVIGTTGERDLVRQALAGTVHSRLARALDALRTTMEGQR